MAPARENKFCHHDNLTRKNDDLKVHNKKWILHLKQPNVCIEFQLTDLFVKEMV